MRNVYFIIKTLFLAFQIFIFSLKGAKIMKSVKNWLCKNKGAIASVLVSLLSISELVFEWILGEKTVYVLGFNLIAITGFVLSILIALFTNKFTTSTFQEVIDKAKEQYLKDKNNGLTPKMRKKIGNKINELEKVKFGLRGEYKKYIDNYEFGIASPEEIAQYKQYESKVKIINDQIATLKAKLGDK